MSKKTLLILCALMSVTGISLISLYLTRKSAQLEASSIFPLFSRHYLDSANISLIARFEAPHDIFTLFYGNGHLYGQTWTSQEVIMIDSTGKILKKYGGKGKGPGEFSFISHCYADTKQLSVLDNRNQTFTEFSHEGQIQRIYQYNQIIDQGCRLNTHQCLVQTNDPGSKAEELFQIFDILTGSNTRVTVPRILPSNTDDIGARGFELAGTFIHNHHNRVIRVSAYAGCFVMFDTTGKFITYRQTIDKSPLPRVVKEGGMISLANKTRRINIRADADDQYLYVLSNAKHPNLYESPVGSNTSVIIDMYSISNGDYYGSIKLPEALLDGKQDKHGKYPATSIAVCPQGFYLLQGTNIYHYKIDFIHTTL